MDLRRLTLAEFHDAIRAQGVPRVNVAAKCPMCGTVQSMADLIAAGAGSTEDEVEKYMGFSCVGRFTNAGPHRRGMPPGRGCDWTLGGLFTIHKLEVVTPDDERHPRFELATPEEAQAHLRGEPQKFTPVRIQLQRTKGWTMPANTVKVDRSTKWGNPWTAANSGRIDPALKFACETAPRLNLSELRGKNLACWCKPGAPCHADVLLELANTPTETTPSRPHVDEPHLDLPIVNIPLPA